MSEQHNELHIVSTYHDISEIDVDFIDVLFLSTSQQPRITEDKNIDEHTTSSTESLPQEQEVVEAEEMSDEEIVAPRARITVDLAQDTPPEAPPIAEPPGRDTTDGMADAVEVEELEEHAEPPGDTIPLLSQAPRGRLRLRTGAICALLVLFLASTMALWHDVTAVHAYLYTLDSSSGTIRTQQDIGSYAEKISLTAPLHTQSSVLVGVHADAKGGTQQVLTLAGNETTWHNTRQFPASLAHGALSLTAGGNLIVESDAQLQVMTPGGRLLWQQQSEQPTRSVHHFQPVSDGQNIYTVKSVKHSQLIAYDLRNGIARWIQTLDDTLNYAPPLLLDGNTLYVASDHNVYALNSADGSLLWTQHHPSRTLLMENEGQTHLLLAVGEQGLAALDPATGALRWLFHSQVSSAITAPQLYQAILTSFPGGNVVYTTGTTWQLPQAQQQVWLYAINASTGTPLWSQQVASGFIGADAGRLFSPLFDSAHNIVVLQEQQENNSQDIIAFDAREGTLRWKTPITDVENTTPTLLRTSGGFLVLLATTENSLIALRHATLLRVLMMIALVLSLLGLLVLCITLLKEKLCVLKGIVGARFIAPVVFPYIATRISSTLHDAGSLIPTALWMNGGRDKSGPYGSQRALVAPALLVTLVAVGVVGYVQLSQIRNTTYQVVASTGSIQRQYTETPSTQLEALDTQGSVIATGTSNNLHQLREFNSAGNEVWSTFLSEGTFSLPGIPTRPGTLLVELSDRPYTYRYAPNDPVYPQQLNSLLALFLLDRSTGKTLWQHIVIYPGEQQSATVLAVDKNFIYVVSRQTTPTPGSIGPGMQLLGVNQATGNIDWRIFGPSALRNTQQNSSILLLKDGQAIWQVAGTLYAIDTTLGQIEWRRRLADNTSNAASEESQIVETAGMLLVTEHDGVYAIDSKSGNELWNLLSGSSNAVVSEHIVLMYRNAQLQAFDTVTQRLIWSRAQLHPIQHLTISSDGKVAYVQVQSSPSTLMALDTQTGRVRWVFKAPTDTSFKQLAPQQELLLITLCFSGTPGRCTHERLYVLDSTTGSMRWKLDGTSITNIHETENGKMLVLRVTSSPWADMLAFLYG